MPPVNTKIKTRKRLSLVKKRRPWAPERVHRHRALFATSLDTRESDGGPPAPIQPKSSSPLLSLSLALSLSYVLCNCLRRRALRRRPNSPTSAPPSASASAIHSLPGFLPSSFQWQRPSVPPPVPPSFRPSPPFLLSSQLHRTHIISASRRARDRGKEHGCRHSYIAGTRSRAGILARTTLFPGPSSPRSAPPLLQPIK